MADHTPDRFISNVDTLLDEHLSHAYYSITHLADDLNVSRVHLYRLIKAHTGKSCSKYVLDRRLDRAHEMLKAGKNSVTDVAFAVGFNNLSYFARAFRAKFDVNPSQLRNTKK